MEIAITPRFAADDCPIAPGALERLVALGGGHPRATMRLAQQTRRLHKTALTVARAVAAGDQIPRRVPPSIRDRVLKPLQRAGIIEHVARGGWRIVNPLFRDYLRTLTPLG